MAAAELEALRKLYAEWAEGNLGSVELFAEDVMFEAVPEGGTSHGVPALQAYMRDFLAQWREFRVVGEEFEELDDGILVTERQFATGASSGVAMDTTFYAAWTFRDGKAARVHWELDREPALEAFGLPV
jgi:ketosteroid isomerase-like protein